MVGQRPKDLRKGTWRLDRGANRVAHDRMQEALEVFHSVEGDRGTILRDVLLGQVHDQKKTLQCLKNLGKFNRAERVEVEMNPSQTDAMDAAMKRRVTIIQEALQEPEKRTQPSLPLLNSPAKVATHSRHSRIQCCG